MMSQPSFWTTEGFLPTHLAEIVEVVGVWIHAGINATKSGTNPAAMSTAAMDASLLEESAAETAESSALAQAEAKFKFGYVARLKTAALAEIKRQKHKDHSALIERRESLTESHTSEQLFKELLGGKTMSRGSLTPTEWQVLHQGVPAVPATLEFAKLLAWNASRDSGIFLHGCFKYSSISSNQLDAFANEINNFVSKTQSFLTTIMTYSGQKGIEFLESEIMGFVKGAETALVSAIEPKVDAIVNRVIDTVENELHGAPPDPATIIAKIKGELDSIMSGGASAAKSMAMIQLECLPGAGKGAADPSGVAKAASTASGVEGDMLMVFEEMRTLMGDLMALLPSAVSTVNGARSEVAMVAQMMTSIFATFGTGP